MEVKLGATLTGVDLSAIDLWDAAASDAVGFVMVANILDRMSKGMGADGVAFDDYSDTPISILFDSPTGQRLHPKGGTPVYSRKDGERQISGKSNPFRIASEDGPSRRSRADARGRKIIGRRYEGGYADYKRLSRRRTVDGLAGNGVASPTGDVDLLLSGQLYRSIGVIAATEDQAVIAMSGQPAEYGIYVDARRPFMGIAPDEVDDLVDEVAGIIGDRLAGAPRGPLKRVV